jgi:hypothetical protein
VRETIVTTETPRPGPSAKPGIADGCADALTRAELLALPAVVDIITAGRALGIGRTRAYHMARHGIFPVRVLRPGGTYRVPTAELLAYLGIDPNQPAPRSATGPATGQPADAAA